MVFATVPEYLSSLIEELRLKIERFGLMMACLRNSCGNCFTHNHHKRQTLTPQQEEVFTSVRELFGQLCPKKRRKFRRQPA